MNNEGMKELLNLMIKYVGKLNFYISSFFKRKGESYFESTFYKPFNYPKYLMRRKEKK